MKKNLILSGLLILLVSLVAVAGCGDKAADTEEAAKAADAVVLHDCEGDCGMTEMAPEHTKEIKGHFYCTGCALKMEADDKTEAATSH